MNSINVGDKIRISVELIRDIDNLPDHSSVVATVKEIKDGYPGEKTMVLSHEP